MLQNQSGIPSTRDTTERRGFALFMALGALVIIGVLVAASSFITLQENRLGQNSLVQARAFAVAEYGLNKIQSDWDKTPNLTMANGAKFDTTYTLSGQGTANVRYIRLNDETFWIVSEGLAIVGNNTSLSRQARKRVGAILRLRIPTLEAKGAITAGGNVTVRGNAGVNGRDSIPANWGCTNSQQNMPGIVVPPGSSVTTQGSSATIAGSPATATDTAAASASTYFGFGEENWSTLIAMKNVQIDSISATPTRTPYPTVVGGSCNKSDAGNWGEPMRPATYENSMQGALQPDCYNYFPIIYAPGGLKLSGNGRGQGILLINGNLEINGSFDWYGVIVVTNDIIRGNGNAKVMGAVMARNETTADASVISGTTSYNYSQCGVERALKGSAQVVQAKERAWAELY